MKCDRRAIPTHWGGGGGGGASSVHSFLGRNEFFTGVVKQPGVKNFLSWP